MGFAALNPPCGAAGRGETIVAVLSRAAHRVVRHACKCAPQRAVREQRQRRLRGRGETACALQRGVDGAGVFHQLQRAVEVGLGLFATVDGADARSRARRPPARTWPAAAAGSPCLRGSRRRGSCPASPVAGVVQRVVDQLEGEAQVQAELGAAPAALGARRRRPRAGLGGGGEQLGGLGLDDLQVDVLREVQVVAAVTAAAPRPRRSTPRRAARISSAGMRAVRRPSARRRGRTGSRRPADAGRAPDQVRGHGRGAAALNPPRRRAAGSRCG